MSLRYGHPVSHISGPEVPGTNRLTRVRSLLCISHRTRLLRLPETVSGCLALHFAP